MVVSIGDHVTTDVLVGVLQAIPRIRDDASEILLGRLDLSETFISGTYLGLSLGNNVSLSTVCLFRDVLGLGLVGLFFQMVLEPSIHSLGGVTADNPRLPNDATSGTVKSGVTRAMVTNRAKTPSVPCTFPYWAPATCRRTISAGDKLRILFTQVRKLALIFFKILLVVLEILIER